MALIRLLPLALLLAGCAGKSEPAVEIRTVEVPVLRVEKCVAEKDIPRVPGALPKRPTNVSSALDLAVAKVLEFQKYAAKADAVMRGCAG